MAASAWCRAAPPDRGLGEAMQDARSSTMSPSLEDSKPRPRWLAAVLAVCASDAVIVAALFLLARPYTGISLDARLYIGRGLADLDPGGVGRDVMFLNDGQSGFSLYTIVLRHLVGWLGASTAAIALSLAGVAAWFAAAAVLAGRLARGRAKWAILVALAVLPAFYGYTEVLRAAEANAVPRPFAEAGVLLGLAALASGRRVLACAAIGLACLFHPIMGLAGVAVLGLFLVVADRRWLLAALLGAVGVAIAAALGLPLFGRLFTGIDPEWRAVLDAKSPILFPSLWPGEAWGRIALQTATLLIAATLVEGRARLLLVCGLLVGLGGLALTLLAGDRWASLLAVQAQPWRMLWLTVVLATAALAVCALALYRRGPGFQVVLALLTLGWMFLDAPVIASSAAGLAVLAYAMAWRGLIDPSRIVAITAWVVVGVLVAFKIGLQAWAITAILQATVVGSNRGLGMVRTCAVLLPLVALGWAFRARVGPRSLAAAALGVALSLVALGAFDDRTGFQKTVERGTALPDLAARVATRPGEVLWIGGGPEAWLLLGRPNWITAMQGASVVFSRSLAMIWSERIRRLLALDLATPDDYTAFVSTVTDPLPRLTAASMGRLCAAPDAPTWIVAPLEVPLEPALVDRATLYRLPQTDATFVIAESGFSWRRIDTYALLACRSQSVIE
ncbi:hypothetical protein G3T14_10855 [Methylobacterium sp. BTF04]|uniref:hypothetical protein n=1 Tax=Methylobacterium sp. BTF04 TaxID=2708300 RepID=UPI0013D1280D|nr:hypothetical protein [Methylobacterium sp. BTF04]NEU12636.1 hypothetical protein [Methylobacterium sp. BTF04]